MINSYDSRQLNYDVYTCTECEGSGEQKIFKCPNCSSISITHDNFKVRYEEDYISEAFLCLKCDTRYEVRFYDE